MTKQITLSVHRPDGSVAVRAVSSAPSQAISAGDWVDIGEESPLPVTRVVHRLSNREGRGGLNDCQCHDLHVYTDGESSTAAAYHPSAAAC